MIDQPTSISPVHEIANRYIDALAVDSPIFAEFEGIPGQEGKPSDFSPAGLEASVALTRITLAELLTLTPADDAERIAIGFMQERLQTELAQHDAGESYRNLNSIASPLQAVRAVFDIMPTETETDWTHIASRLESVPFMVEGIQWTLQEGRDRGFLAARRQAVVVAGQCAAFAGDKPEIQAFGFALADAYEGASPALEARLNVAAEAASTSMREFGNWLADDYAPTAPEKDGVGVDRYKVLVRSYLGGELRDPQDTFEWGWNELKTLRARMDEVCKRIDPTATDVRAVMTALDTDPRYTVATVDDFIAWAQEVQEDAIAALNGVHFDIPPAILAVKVREGSPGSSSAPHYISPSEDLSRPGGIVYPYTGRTNIPTWGEVTTAYHEAVPGHHLQLALLRTMGDQLTRYQRLMGFISGHGEGWALYAEHLMDELGYFSDPAHELGFLQAQSLRAARVVIDIGVHCDFPIPADSPVHAGEEWTYQNAHDFAVQVGLQDAWFMDSEIDRYFGWPGQAISYKVGERVWLECREEARAREGASFDLKAWHTKALELGAMGLDQLRDELRR